MSRRRETAPWRWRRRVARGARGDARKRAAAELRAFVHAALKAHVEGKADA